MKHVSAKMFLPTEYLQYLILLQTLIQEYLIQRQTYADETNG